MAPTAHARAASSAVAEASLLDEIVAKSRIARSDSEHARARDLIAELVREVMQGTVVVSDNLGVTLDARIAEIDELVSAQLSEVMHHPDFQQLESSWTGLHYLCRHTSTGAMMRIQVFNASKKELIKDFKTAIDFDQSALFKKVYEEEFGTFGGAPFGTLIGDFALTRQPEDMYFLDQMAHVAAASHAPFISAASPEMFGLESFTELSRPRDLSKALDTVDYAKWKSFRESEDARYVGLTVPRFLGRLPYNAKDGTTVEGFNFAEDVDGSHHGKYLWVNAAYAMGARLTAAFESHGWCAAIRGVEGGGLVEDLPTHTFKTDEGEVALKCPTEIAITDRREKELSDLGFIPLVHCKGRDYAAFFGAQSSQSPKKYDTDSANANAVLSSQLQYIYSVCRIAHYLKSMMRDKIGSFASAGSVEEFLNRWIRQYVVEDDNASQETKATYPLREASVEVSEVPGRAGVYRAVSFIRPHFQLDELSVSLRLVAELPQSRKAPTSSTHETPSVKDIYVKFEGGSELQGDSTDTKHANEIEVSTFRHMITQPKSSSASSAGGHTAERTEHGEMLFTKDIDKATSKLMRASSAGTVYPKATITFYRAYGGKGSTGTSQSRIDYFKIVLEDVVVSSVNMAVTDGELPAETFGLKYGKVVWEYKQHKLDGSSASTGPAGWDLRKNIAT